MLNARVEEVDRVRGSTLGADDYVVKPFSRRELVARVQAALRRIQRPPAAEHRNMIARRWDCRNDPPLHQ